MEKYTKLAAEDKARCEIKVAVESTDDELVEEDKPVAKKSDTKPKKKMTGYTHFCQLTRESVKEDTPEMKATEVTKELARLWKELSDEDKKEWSDSAAHV